MSSSPKSTPIHPPLCLRPGTLDIPTPDVDPARWNGASMDAAKFRTLLRVPGYRYEPLDGTARIRPVDRPVILLAAPGWTTGWPPQVPRLPGHCARRVHEIETLS